MARQTQYDVYSSGEACALVERGVGVSIVEPLGVAYRQPPGIAVCRLEPAIHFTFNMLLPRFKKASQLTNQFVADLKGRIVQFGALEDPRGLREIKLAEDTEK